MRFRVMTQAKFSVEKDVGSKSRNQFEINLMQAFFGEIVDFPDLDLNSKDDENQKTIDVEFYLLPEDVANNEEPH